jgi:hypothetical protein
VIDFTCSIRARQRDNSVCVDGKDYEIHTEFFHWVLFERKLIKWNGDYNSLDKLCDYLYKYCIPENRQAGLEELKKFCRNEQPLPHPTGEKSNVMGVDWKIDSEYIRAAFKQQYDIDLLTTDLHWHDFLGYFNALKDTVINDIMSARYSKEKKGFMKEQRERWKLAR